MRPSPTSIAGTRTDTRPVSIQSRVNAGPTIGPGPYSSTAVPVGRAARRLYERVGFVAGPLVEVGGVPRQRYVLTLV
jgi:hypothetical protein